MPIEPDLRLDGSLPIHDHAPGIEDLLLRHRVVVLAGETGSGKSTQLPRLLLRAGFGKRGKITITQPRRIAAVALAARVAEETGTAGTSFVAHRVRFDDRTRGNTRIVFATDGMLLTELALDPLLSRHEVVVVDEAHERTLSIDLLLAVLRGLLPRRPDLRVVCCSATLDTEAFAEAFASSLGAPVPVVRVEGRSWPVEIVHPEDLDLELGADGTDESLAQRASDGCRALLQLVQEGDVLAFLPGEADIRTVRGILEAQEPQIEVVPLYGRLSLADQNRVFRPGSSRRVVLSTNVAETSLTVPRIRAVLDTGLARLARWNPRNRTRRLLVESISQASAQQRAGRCGRLGPGICLRLWPRSATADLEERTPPEIHRSDLAEVVLRALQLNLGSPEDLPFLEPPDPRSWKEARQHLEELGAIREGSLTEQGAAMARLPLDARSARLVLAARERGCLHEGAVLAAALALPEPWDVPEGKEAQARQIRSPFLDRQSDFVTLLNLWEGCMRAVGPEGSGNALRRFAREVWAHPLRLREWRLSVRQIEEQVTAAMGSAPKSKPADYATLHQAILSAFGAQVLRHDEDASRGGPPRHRSARGRVARIFPGSVLSRGSPTWIVAAELVETSDLWARTCAVVDPAWIPTALPGMVRASFSPPWFDSASQRVVASRRFSLGVLSLPGAVTVGYAAENGAVARDTFCREALAGGLLEPIPRLLAAHREVRAGLAMAESRMRRRNLDPGEEALATWYAARVPDGVASGPDFLKWLSCGGAAAMVLTESDLIPEGSELPDPIRHPLSWAPLGPPRPLEWRFEPGTPEDGCTLAVTEDELLTAPNGRWDWLPPALLEEKIEWMLSGLPRPVRQKLGAPALAAREAATVLRPLSGVTSLGQALSTWLEERGVPNTGFAPEESAPLHLRLRLRLTDQGGKTVIEGRDRTELRAAVVRRRQDFARRMEVELRARLPCDLLEWPADLRLDHPLLLPEGIRLHLALRPGARTVDVVACATAKEACAVSVDGVGRLLATVLDRRRRDLAWLSRDLRPGTAESLRLLPPRDPSRWGEDIAHAAMAWITEAHRETDPPLEAAGFERALRRAEVRLAAAREALPSLWPRLSEARAVFESTARSIPAGAARWQELVRRTRDRLAPDDFPAGWSLPALIELPRWWTAARRRLEGAFADPAREARRQAELAPWMLSLQEAGGARGAPRRPGELAFPDRSEQLAELRFLLEELRVLIWAQELGAVVPASPRRLAEAWTARGLAVPVLH